LKRGEKGGDTRVACATRSSALGKNPVDAVQVTCSTAYWRQKNWPWGDPQLQAFTTFAEKIKLGRGRLKCGRKGWGTIPARP